MRIGVTGHQQLGSNETVIWLVTVLEECIKQCGIDQGVTSLAVGADQLYAEVLIKTHIPYSVIIPCKGYETTFQNSYDLERYQKLLLGAFEKVQLLFGLPSETAFFEAGKQVVDLSDLVIAIWDGLPAKGLGGTGDIVKYALSMRKKVIHINPIIQKVNVI